MTLTPNILIRAMQQVEFPRKLGVCERLFANSLSRYGVCWVRTAAGLPWKLDLRHPTHRWIVYGMYEGPQFLRWARKFLPANGIVVDSGANIGQMLQYLAQWVPMGKVLAFEPGNEAADWLQECLDRNRSLPVSLLRNALGSANCEMSLVSLGIDTGHGACNQVRAHGEGEPVVVRRLASVLRERNIERVDLWKLDVEGFELEALSGAEEFLAERRIRAIYAELGFGNAERIRSYLRSFGYVCRFFRVGGGLYEPARLPEHENGLFLLE